MFKVITIAGMLAGLLTLGACASHQGNAGKLNAQMVNGNGDVNGTGKRVCIRKTKTGSHMSSFYCMTSMQYKQYKKDQEVEQDKWHQKQLQHDGTAGGGGGGL